LDLPEPVANVALRDVALAGRTTRRFDTALGARVNLDGGPADSPQWRIPCQDVANRSRYVTLFVEHGRVVLVGPPGETATFSAGQLIELSTALRQAADEAERQR
jgi:hypothetical protein